MIKFESEVGIEEKVGPIGSRGVDTGVVPAVNILIRDELNDDIFVPAMLCEVDIDKQD